MLYRKEGAAFHRGNFLNEISSSTNVGDFHREIQELMSQNACSMPLHLLLSSYGFSTIHFSSQLGGNTFIEEPVHHPLYACNHISCRQGYSETEPKQVLIHSRFITRPDLPHNNKGNSFSE